MKYLFILLGTLLFSEISNAQSDTNTFYREKDKVRLYTPDEFRSLVFVDSIKSSKSQMLTDNVIMDSSIENGRNVVVFDKKYSFKGSGSTMRIGLDKAYVLKDQQFPKFKIKDISGKTYSLDDFKGKPTLINFWFHTCGPCKAEIPTLNKIMETYGDKVNFVALTYDRKDLIQPILDQRPFNFIQLIDAGDLVNKLGLKAAPKNLFLDRKGVIRQVYDGVDLVYNQERERIEIGDGTSIKNMLDRLLDEQ